jgi:cytochrome c peroxidase
MATLVAVAIVAAPAIVSVGRSDDRSLYTADELIAIACHTSPLTAPPADATNRVADDPRAAALGQFLFFDRHLSINNKFSCASCHKPERVFTDGRALAKTLAIGTRNTPTLLNAADNRWFFWDGRADSMWAQVLHVAENPREFGNDRLHLAHVVNDDAPLHHAYEKIFGALPPLSNMARFPAHGRPAAQRRLAVARIWRHMSDADRDAVNRVFSNLGKAIAAYERRLIRRNSPFDQFATALRTGDVAGQAVLSPAAKRGLKLFVGRGRCDLCHSGPDFTDSAFHNVGLPVRAGAVADSGREAGIRQLTADPFNAAGHYSDRPHGRMAKRLAFLPAPNAMRGAFKTPTLRNVARTPPYLHDGRHATLDRVIELYAKGKAAIHGKLVGKREGTLDLIPHFTRTEIADLGAFLKTLNSAPLPRALTQPPAHP